jgi:quinoprotein relay system zinc metallohydrolase 2
VTESSARAGWWVLCALAFATPVFGAEERIPEFSLTQIAAGVFVHLGKPLPLDAPGHDDIANIGFIVGAKCIAVIDTGGSVRIGRALRAAITARSAVPICYVINTHVHVDHVLGNVAFKEEHTSFIGHARLPAAMARSRNFFLEQYAADLDSSPAADQIIAPDRLVEHSVDLDLGDRHLILRAWPTAHTDCDLTVYDARTETLWTGDLLFRERLPALDGSVKGWLAIIDDLSSAKVHAVVPGHGPVSRDVADSFSPERRYLQSLVEGVRKEIAAGKPMEQAITEVSLTEKSRWLLWDSVHPRNVARAYEELEWE